MPKLGHFQAIISLSTFQPLFPLSFCDYNDLNVGFLLESNRPLRLCSISFHSIFSLLFRLNNNLFYLQVYWFFPPPLLSAVEIVDWGFVSFFLLVQLLYFSFPKFPFRSLYLLLLCGDFLFFIFFKACLQLLNEVFGGCFNICVRWFYHLCHLGVDIYYIFKNSIWDLPGSWYDN